ncbi:hypothetical protein EDC02_2847 [Micromonospora sp. Llam0]|uniref:hypothetical protein n=1 Tax=Micromonospora sp. Llam0 TaxID=2485143 RepID=UPI000F4A8C55|nr:hypothetical protein [Micromonospora sp. Llam0]ROO60928.1 hypothetical protein EDC02_2847 [Micromonospora sp. Llam0]
MSDEKLTMVETAALLILFAEDGELSNVKMTQEHGCKLEKRSREKLERLKLIEVEGAPRRIVLRLSDAGWVRCRAEFAAGSPPPRSGSLGGALYAVLLRLDRFLNAQGLSLADFMNASKERGNETPVEEPVAGTGYRPDEAAVEERVRAAYHELARQAGDLVDLADLRDLVDDLDRADIDAALRRLHRRPGVTLVPEANQKAIDPRTRAAAVVVGDQPKHMITMAAS